MMQVPTEFSRLDLLRIECAKCGRSGRYHLHKLIGRYGREPCRLLLRKRSRPSFAAYVESTLGDAAQPPQSSAGWHPPPPLIVAAQHDTPAMLKMLRLTEHMMGRKTMARQGRSAIFCTECARKTDFMSAIEPMSVLTQHIEIDFSGGQTNAPRVKQPRTQMAG